MNWRKIAEALDDLWPVAVGAVALIVPAIAISGSAARRRRRSGRVVSVWWDVIGSATIRYLGAHIRNLKALGIGSVCVMLTDTDGTTRNFTDDELLRFSSALRSAGIGVSIATWPYPTDRWLSTIPDLIDLAGRTGASAIEFDIEMNWTAALADGRSGLDDAARALASAMLRSPVPWGITTNMGRISTDAVTIGRLGSFLVPQAYSTYHSDDPAGHRPGAYQDFAYQKARGIYGPGMSIIMGLPAYGQEGFTGIGPQAAMLAAAARSFLLGVHEIRFWSWKWIGGHDGAPRNRYAYDALAQIRQRFL